MIDFVIEHWYDIFGVVGIVGTCCSAIVKTFGNFKWASAIVNLCDKASIFNTPANKAILEKYSKKNK